MEEKEPGTVRRKHEVVTYRDWCKRCHICVSFCPKEALMIDKDGYPYIGAPERCTGCGTCEMRCPDFAINLQELPVGENHNESNSFGNFTKDEQKSEKVGS